MAASTRQGKQRLATLRTQHNVFDATKSQKYALTSLYSETEKDKRFREIIVSQAGLKVHQS